MFSTGGSSMGRRGSRLMGGIPSKRVMANWGAMHTASSATQLTGHRKKTSLNYAYPHCTSTVKASSNWNPSPVSVPPLAYREIHEVENHLNPLMVERRMCNEELLPDDDTSSLTQSSRHDCKVEGCRIVTINVSGLVYEIKIGDLERHPNTLLGNPQKRLPFYDENRKEYFFDRYRPAFETIFNYYKYGGKLRRPPTIPDDIFLEEVSFYEIEKEVIDAYKTDEGYTEDEIELPENEISRKVWMLFEYPETSAFAFAIAVISVSVTMVSIILFCMETLPEFKGTECKPGETPNFLDKFFLIESFCSGWFTLEFVIRLFASPSKLRYFKDWKNMVDVAAVAPYYITLFTVLSTMSCDNAKSSASLAFLRVIRLVRIFKLTKHSAGLQVLMLTFKASVGGLALFLVALSVCILVFSAAIYYVEFGNVHDPNSDIHVTSIPDAFWWCIITMCTVGYGDKVPSSFWGKLVGASCALAGVLTLAIPVPIITENFNKFYSHRRSTSKKIQT